MYDTRLRLSNQVVEEVKTHFQDLVFKTIIHRNVTLGESSMVKLLLYMTQVWLINYLNLASEILGNEQKKLEEENLVSNE